MSANAGYVNHRKTARNEARPFSACLQMRVLALCLFQDGNVEVGVFPELPRSGVIETW